MNTWRARRALIGITVFLLVTMSLARRQLARDEGNAAVSLGNPLQVYQAIHERTLLTERKAVLAAERERFGHPRSEWEWAPVWDQVRLLASQPGLSAAEYLTAIESRLLPTPRMPRSDESARHDESTMHALVEAWLDLVITETEFGKTFRQVARRDVELAAIDQRVQQLNRSILSTRALLDLLPDTSLDKLLDSEQTSSVGTSAPETEVSSNTMVQLWRAVCDNNDQEGIPLLRKLLAARARFPDPQRREAAERSEQQMFAEEFAHMLREIPTLATDDLLMEAATEGQVELLRVLLEHMGPGTAQDRSSGDTALHRAVRSGNPEAIRLLALAGFDARAVDREGRSSVELAWLKGRRDWAATMLVASLLTDEIRRLPAPPIDPHDGQLVIEESPGRMPGYEGTPLHVVSITGNLGVARRLVEARASVNAVDAMGRTPMHYAAEQGDFMIVELLLCHGADANVRDRAGKTPLHLATERNEVHAVLSLLAFGADAAIRDAEGQIPAAISQGAELASLLANAAARTATGPEHVGLTGEPPTSPDLIELGQQAIVSVGHPEIGWIRGFVISKEDRLVVSLAEVSDLHQARGELFIRDSQEREHAVTRLLNHPGMLRIVPDTYEYLVRSADPRDGRVGPIGPQLALLKVAETASFSAQLDLALPDELQDFSDQQHPAVFAYLPAESRNQMSVQEGAIVSELALSLATQRERLGLIIWKHDIAVTPEQRGGPLLRRDGRVVGVLTRMTTWLESGNHDGRPELVEEGDALPVDLIWQMLSHYELASGINPDFEPSQLSGLLFEQPDPGLEAIRQTIRLVRQARENVEGSNFQEASKLLSEAARLVPDLPSIYLARSHLHTMYVVRQRPRLTDAQRLRQNEYANAAAKKLVELAPNDPMSETVLWTTHNNLAGTYWSRDRARANQMRREVLDACENLLRRDNLNDSQRAEIYNLRAGAYTGLERYAEAEADFDRAIAMGRSVVEFYENRAYMYELSGNMEKARADRARVAELRSLH